MGKQVSVFVCGVQKGGTTSLHKYFSKHPGLSPPTRKETHFFSNDSEFWSAPNYKKFDAWYSKDDADRLRFDITPIYCFWPPSLTRLRAYNPDAKLIFLFRDPFKRAWSQYRMEYSRGRETLSFADAIRAGRSRYTGLPELAPEKRLFAYVERGYYADQVRRTLELFPEENILFLRSTDLLKNHVKTLHRISEFLDIDEFPDIGIVRDHKRAKIKLPALPTEADHMLIANELKDQLDDFKALTKLDISDWPTVHDIKLLK